MKKKAKNPVPSVHDKRPSLLREFWEFLIHNKRWWLLPIIVFLLGIGLLVLISSRALSPFMYTLF